MRPCYPAWLAAQRGKRGQLGKRERNKLRLDAIRGGPAKRPGRSNLPPLGTSVLPPLVRIERRRRSRTERSRSQLKQQSTEMPAARGCRIIDYRVRMVDHDDIVEAFDGFLH
jgi:hypothetical protein